jgi:hypothetical protein
MLLDIIPTGESSMTSSNLVALDLIIRDLKKNLKMVCFKVTEEDKDVLLSDSKALVLGMSYDDKASSIVFTITSSTEKQAPRDYSYKPDSVLNSLDVSGRFISPEGDPCYVSCKSGQLLLLEFPDRGTFDSVSTVFFLKNYKTEAESIKSCLEIIK